MFHILQQITLRVVVLRATDFFAQFDNSYKVTST